MDREQLLGRYVRLTDELAMVQNRPDPSRAWTDRLASDIALTAREIVTLQPADEQVSESVWAVLLNAEFEPDARRRPAAAAPEGR